MRNSTQNILDSKNLVNPTNLTVKTHYFDQYLVLKNIFLLILMSV